MNRTPISRSACSLLRICRISAWVVTSSAVVGSSQSSSFGSTVSAPAIMTRCSMPPESSCGYCRKCRSASSSPTARSSSTRLGASAVCGPAVVEPQRLGEEVTHPPDRVDAGARVLEDHRDLGATQLEESVARWRPRPRSPRRARCPRPRSASGQSPSTDPGGHRLARSRLAHQPDHLAGRRPRSDTSSRIGRSARPGRRRDRSWISSSAAIRGPVPRSGRRAPRRRR